MMYETHNVLSRVFLFLRKLWFIQKYKNYKGKMKYIYKLNSDGIGHEQISFDI